MSVTDRTDPLHAVPIPHRELFIGGRWTQSLSGHEFPIFDPATGETIVRIVDATPDDGLRALNAAVDAADFWAATAPRVRADILRAVFDLVHEHRDEIALLMTAEMGKPLAESYGEVTYGAEFLRWFSEEAVRIEGHFGTMPGGSDHMLVSRRPVGPCYLITPWNFPLAMATRKIAPALAAGCTVVIKPAEMTPLTTLYLAGLFEQAGLPAGVLNVVTTTSSAALSAPILADRRLRKLSFTGSTPVGRNLLKQAADNILRTSMELGGSAPFIVFDDADLDKAVDGAIAAKFRNIGQACTAANRFIVHRSRAQEFTSRLGERVARLPVGHGTQPGTEIGPLISSRASDDVHRLVTEAVERGAVIVTGGRQVEGPGSFYEPTVLTSVPADSTIAHEEIFGPVIAVTEFDTEDEALQLANDTIYGLASYVFTESLPRAMRVVEELEAGMMGLNAGVLSNAAAPFGGVKQSGLGREGGHGGIEEYLSQKYTLMAS